MIDVTNVPGSDRMEQLPTPNTPHKESPELDRSDEQQNELDKRSDLDVPGGKGFVKIESESEATRPNQVA